MQLIPLIIGAVVGGTELGTQLAGVGQPSPHEMERQQQEMLDKMKQQQATQDERTKAAAIARAAPDAQEAAGAGLNQTGLLSLAMSQAGVPGDPYAGNQALSQLFGANASSSVTGPSATTTSALPTHSPTDPGGSSGGGGGDIMNRLLEMFQTSGGSGPLGAEFAGGYA